MTSGQRDRAVFGSLVATLTGQEMSDSGLPEIPDVLAEETYRSAQRCWQLLGQGRTRLALNRIGLNERRADPDCIDSPISLSLAVQLARVGSGLVVPTPRVAGLEWLTVEQLAALTAARASLRKLQDFNSPGGAVRYAAVAVAAAIKDIRRCDPSKPRLGRPPNSVQLESSDQAVVSAIEANKYQLLPRAEKARAMKLIMTDLGIQRWRFFRVLRDMKQGQK